MSVANLRRVRRLRAEERRSLCITVLFTDVPSTLRALSRAAAMAAGLDASIELLAPIAGQPLTAQCHRTTTHLRTITGRTSIPTLVKLMYGEDRVGVIRHCLKKDSVLVVAWKKRWLFDKTSRLVKQLRRDGYNVITVE